MLARLRLEKAQAHRFAYIAIINRCLEQPGSKRRFARKLAISQQHLSYILAVEVGSQGGALEQRVPSPDLARQIASTLSMPPEEQAHLLAHMLAARALTATDEAPMANSGRSSILSYMCRFVSVSPNAWPCAISMPRHFIMPIWHKRISSTSTRS